MNQLMWPVVFAIGGALAFALSSNAKLAELGKIVFFVGAFWLCHALSGRALHF